MLYFVVFAWICSPSCILGFGVQLEGLIDLGPNWNYKYNLSPLSTTKLLNEPQSFSYSQEGEKNHELTNVITENGKDQTISISHIIPFVGNNYSVNNSSDVTPISNVTYEISKKAITEKSNIRMATTQMFQHNADKNHKSKIKTHIATKSYEHDKDVSNDEDAKYILDNENIKRDRKINKKLHNFTMHVYKQSLRVWENMLKIANNNEIKSKMKIIKNHYIQKYVDFMRQSKKHKMKTKLGPKKLILNAIDMSNRIMQRLVSFLLTYENSLNGRSKSVNIIQRELEKEEQIEYDHACKKFGVCRTRNDFSVYLIELINIILQTDNAKIKQAADALTEVVKTNDFTQIIYLDTQDRLRKRMADIELWDPFVVKGMFVILRNVLSHKIQPIVIMDLVDQEVANKTVAFHEVIDTLNQNVYTSVNITSWNAIKKHLEEWRDGKRKEVVSVFNSLIQIIKKGMEKMDTKMSQEFDTNMNIILKPLRIIG